MAVDKVIQFQIPATFNAVRKVDEAVMDLLTEIGGVDITTCYNVQLAVHEICINVVEHAYQCQVGNLISVMLQTWTQPRRLITIELRDSGRSFDPTVIRAPDLDELQEGGYGLFLAQTLLDEVHYSSQDAENVWQLKKLL